MSEATPSPRAGAAIEREFPAAAQAFAEAAERALVDPKGVSSGALELVLTAAIKLYAAKAETEERSFPPVAVEKITPTEVVLFVSELLRTANISLFDLAMWYRRGARS
ncbi:MAG TPA: hypothetical protein VFI48_16895 [Hyphomicrobiaceae bacterium]|nr:hypothetical protein [Hyphomicrobiaceae bacterium]